MTSTDQPIDVDAFVAFEAGGWNRIGDAYHDFFEPTISGLLGSSPGCSAPAGDWP